MASGTGYWFSHDYNARTDGKIKKLIAKQGMQGYGAYWAIVEDLYNNANALQLDCESIAYDLRMEIDVIKSVINDFELFNIDANIISSKSVQRRIDERNNKSVKASEAAKKRWGDANALHPHSKRNAIKGNNIKGNKKKRKESIESNNLSFEKFWDLYGKKVESKKCNEKWERLTDEQKTKIFETLPAYVANTPDTQFRKNPSTYLNNHCWDDELPPSPYDCKGNRIDRLKHPDFPVGYEYSIPNIYNFEHKQFDKMQKA